jgi:hypothetical protein
VCEMKFRNVMFLSVGSAGMAQSVMGAVSFEIGDDPSPVNLVLLFVLVFVIIGTLYGTRSLFQLLLGFFQHRRACHVDAVLETVGHRFEGHLSIIGLNGCRFQHVNKSSEQRFRSLLGGTKFNDFDVRICGVAHPVFVDGFHVFYSPLYFYVPISRGELGEILKTSRIEPYLVPQIGHASTRKEWRASIARRTAIIAAQKAANQRQATAGN